MALRSMEGQIEEFVEGLMARAFGSGLQPVEIGRRLRRVAVRDRRVNVKGVAIAANRFVIELSQADHDRILGQGSTITRDLIDEVRGAATREGLSFSGPVAVELTASPTRRAGTFSISGVFDDTPAPLQAAALQLSDGRQVEISAAGVRIGRHHENDLVIDESNVSRFHAQVLPGDQGWRLVDNNSTNGTRVDGVACTVCDLSDGDIITIGAATIVFRLHS
jgi:hypothetical protein